MTVTQLRPRPIKRNWQEIQKAFRNLDTQLCDLERAARAAVVLTERAAKCDTIEDFELSIFAVQQVERLAADLREEMFEATEVDAVQS